MNLISVGISHKTSNIDIRERFYLNSVERELLLSELRNEPAISEALVISTCNRTEIYAFALDINPRIILSYLLKIKNIPPNESYEKYFYAYFGVQVAEHLMRVAAGLDSLIIGEKQILGQIKSAIDLSRSMGMLGRTFNILSNVVVRAGKKARTETSIDSGGSSISWAAVSTAQHLLGSLKDKNVLFIGAGKMGRLAVDQLKEKEVGNIYVTSRTCEGAEKIADEIGGTAVSCWEFKDILTKVDFCICSANASHYVLEHDLVGQVMSIRPERRLVCIDISLPRNINPAVARINNVTLVTLDDLENVVEETMSKRRQVISDVKKIIKNKVLEFEEKVRTFGPPEKAAVSKVAYNINEPNLSLF